RPRWPASWPTACPWPTEWTSPRASSASSLAMASRTRTAPSARPRRSPAARRRSRRTGKRYLTSRPGGDPAAPGREPGGGAGAPRVESLWWRECPCWERALAMLRQAMADTGLDPDSIEVREVDTDEAARREEFVGSPTIKIDGRDLQAPADGDPTGLVCRI